MISCRCLVNHVLNKEGLFSSSMKFPCKIVIFSQISIKFPINFLLIIPYSFLLSQSIEGTYIEFSIDFSAIYPCYFSLAVLVLLFLIILPRLFSHLLFSLQANFLHVFSSILKLFSVSFLTCHRFTVSFSLLILIPFCFQSQLVYWFVVSHFCISHVPPRFTLFRSSTDSLSRYIVLVDTT